MKNVRDNIIGWLVISFIFAILFLIFSSCGEDNNPVNNNNNPPVNGENDSLVWQHDSLSIYGIGWKTIDLAIFNLLYTPDSLKLLFTLQGNLSLPDTMYVGVHSTGPNSINFETIDINSLNKDFILRGRTGLPFSLIFKLIFNSNNYRFIKLKNIKLFKVL